MAETRCRVCRAIITDESRLDETGRCLGCRRAKEATDVGMTYGKYEGMMDSNAPWMRKLTAVQRPRQEEDGDAGRRKNGAVVRKHRCPICGSVFEFQRSSKKYCSPECRSKAAEAGLYTGNERSGLCDVCGKSCLAGG